MVIEEFNENIKIKNNNTIISGISRDIQLNKIKEANSKIVEKLQSIEEMYDIEKITIDALQVLIESLNRDHIMKQEELKKKIKKITYEFNIKKYYMKKDLEAKQQYIKSLEIQNITLNKS